MLVTTGNEDTVVKIISRFNLKFKEDINNTKLCINNKNIVSFSIKNLNKNLLNPSNDKICETFLADDTDTDDIESLIDKMNNYKLDNTYYEVLNIPTILNGFRCFKYKDNSCKERSKIFFYQMDFKWEKYI